MQILFFSGNNIWINSTNHNKTYTYQQITLQFKYNVYLSRICSIRTWWVVENYGAHTIFHKPATHLMKHFYMIFFPFIFFPPSSSVVQVKSTFEMAGNSYWFRMNNLVTHKAWLLSFDCSRFGSFWLYMWERYGVCVCIYFRIGNFTSFLAPF